MITSMLRRLGLKPRRASRTKPLNRLRGEFFDACEDRQLLATFTWTGASDTLWTNPGNWTGGPSGSFPGQSVAGDRANFPDGMTNNVLLSGSILRLNELNINSTGANQTNLALNSDIASDYVLVRNGTNTIQFLTSGLRLTAGNGLNLLNATNTTITGNGIFTIDTGTYFGVVSGPASGPLVLPNVEITGNDTSGNSLTLSGSFKIGGNFTRTGTRVLNIGPNVVTAFVATTGTQTVSDSTTTFGTFRIDVSGAATKFNGGTVNIGGDLIIKNVNSATPTDFIGQYNVSRDAISLDTTVRPDALITLVGTGTSTIKTSTFSDPTVANAQFPDVTINKTGTPTVNVSGSPAFRGNFIQNTGSGSITQVGGTVTFAQAKVSTIQLDSANNQFSGIVLNVSGGLGSTPVTLRGQLNLNGNLHSTSAGRIVPHGTDNGFINFNGIVGQTLSGIAGDGVIPATQNTPRSYIPSIKNSKPNNGNKLAITGRLWLTGDWVNVNDNTTAPGTASTDLLIFDANRTFPDRANHVTSGGANNAFGNVELAGLVKFMDTATVNGYLTNNFGDATGTVNLKGNFTFAAGGATFAGGTAAAPAFTLILNGTGDQQIISAASAFEFPLPNTVINKASGNTVLSASSGQASIFRYGFNRMAGNVVNSNPNGVKFQGGFVNVNNTAMTSLGNVTFDYGSTQNFGPSVVTSPLFATNITLSGWLKIADVTNVTLTASSVLTVTASALIFFDMPTMGHATPISFGSLVGTFTAANFGPPSGKKVTNITTTGGLVEFDVE